MAGTSFFRMVLRILSEITNNKAILISTIFFKIMNISFFNLCFDLFSIIAKEVNHIRNNVVCVVARLVFVFFCAFTTGLCNTFQHILEIGVLRSIFPDYVISCNYGLNDISFTKNIGWQPLRKLWRGTEKSRMIWLSSWNLLTATLIK